jgi:stearoyl-CoA desaturase (delta-9 desaturase)
LARTAAAREDRIQWMKSLPFLAVHAVALATVVLTRPTPALLALVAASYFGRMFGITGGYHRYFSHRSYRTSRAFQFLLALLGTTATQKGPLWWAAHHRDHHRFSDQPEDIHSPVQRGFWWSHVGWIMSAEYDRTRLDRVKDLARYPELVWLDRFHVVPAIGYAVALWAVGGMPALLWGYFVGTVLLWHGTFLVNSLAHVFGRRRYDTGDDSRNSAIIALLTGGEGWHNNHHHYQSTANQGWFWWEVDTTYYVLRALAALRIVSDLRLPPSHVRDAHKRAAADATVPVATPLADEIAA